MFSPPPCTSLGAHCRELTLTLRIADLDEDGPEFHDAIATWLTGHRERIAFGRPYTRKGRILVDVTIGVPCRYLEEGGQDGQDRGKLARRTKGGKAGRIGTKARCAAHDMRGLVPPATKFNAPRLFDGKGTYTIVEHRRFETLELQPAVPAQPALPVPPFSPAQRQLPTLQEANPCAGAPCRTADNKRGAACCRDLTIDVVLPADDIEGEALLRARRSPYLCKVTRADVDIIECEVISACHYLNDELNCALHGLVRASGASAKPSICHSWPEGGPDTVYHPGCRLVPANHDKTAIP